MGPTSSQSQRRGYALTWLIFNVHMPHSHPMNNFKAITVGMIMLALFIGLLAEHQSRKVLKEEMLSLKSELQRLAERATTSQQEQATAPESPSPVAMPPDQTAELLALRAEVTELRRRLSDLEHANATVSNWVASAKGPEAALVYPDATKRKDYAFSGYSSPQSAFQSVLWAITQLDAKTFQASIEGDVAAGFASQLQDLPEGVMPGGFKNGAMFKASGYRVLEETQLSDEELRLKVFLEGSRVVIKPVLRRIGGEWKWSRNEL